jgi:hypothetical protein
MGEIQYMDFTRTAVEICEVFFKSVLNGLTEILSIFSWRLYSVVQYICYIYQLS